VVAVASTAAAPAARAQPSAPPAAPPGPASPPGPDAPAGAPPGAEPAAPAISAVPATSLPTTADEALDRASAAYEFGDIQQMVDLARLVADGALGADADERAQGLRLLGIGLFLTGRPDRAEVAFVELLALRPRTRLDRATTRPDVVAFFEQVRRKHGPRKKLAFNLLPPLGQFQNGTPVRGWIILGAEILSFGALAGTYFALRSWEQPGKQSKYPDRSRTFKTVNLVSAGALAATYLVGVVDGFVGYARGDAPDEARVSWSVFHGGAAMRVTF
jgi:hypothetical protein